MNSFGQRTTRMKPKVVATTYLSDGLEDESFIKHIPEVRRVQRSKDPLLIGRLKTEAGRKALEERLKNEPR